MGGPVSVLGGAGGPTLPELASLGVARVSYGPGPLGVALAALSRAAETLLAGGDPPADLAYRP
jgi:2-methylisocitrate lyase-like PEP mutase family enzyme